MVAIWEESLTYMSLLNGFIQYEFINLELEKGLFFTTYR